MGSPGPMMLVGGLLNTTGASGTTSFVEASKPEPANSLACSW